MLGDFSLPDDAPRRRRRRRRDDQDPGHDVPVTITATDHAPAAPEAPTPFAWLSSLKAARRWDR